MHTALLNVSGGLVTILSKIHKLQTREGAVFRKHFQRTRKIICLVVPNLAQCSNSVPPFHKINPSCPVYFWKLRWNRRPLTFSIRPGLGREGLKVIEMEHWAKTVLATIQWTGFFYRYLVCLVDFSFLQNFSGFFVYIFQMFV